MSDHAVASEWPGGERLPFVFLFSPAIYRRCLDGCRAGFRGLREKRPRYDPKSNINLTLGGTYFRTSNGRAKMHCRCSKFYEYSHILLFLSFSFLSTSQRQCVIVVHPLLQRNFLPCFSLTWEIK